MHGVEHALILLRPGDRQHAGIGFASICSGSAPMQPVTMTLPFSASASPMAPSDSCLGAVEKAAGVDDDEVGAVVLARQLIAFGAQPRDDALGIDQRLGAAEALSTSASASARRTLSGIASGTHSGIRISPLGPAIEAIACASWIAGSERSPPQFPE
jgi:hypothetical protein